MQKLVFHHPTKPNKSYKFTEKTLRRKIQSQTAKLDKKQKLHLAFIETH